MPRLESIRPCCGTLTDRTAPSPHARDCRAVTLPLRNRPYFARSAGPYCIARACPIIPLHRAESRGCILTPEGIAR